MLQNKKKFKEVLKTILSVLFRIIVFITAYCFYDSYFSLYKETNHVIERWARFIIMVLIMRYVNPGHC